jgi:hypothetical protein
MKIGLIDADLMWQKHANGRSKEEEYLIVALGVENIENEKE